MGVFCHLSQAVFWRPSGWVPDLESLPSGKALLASTNVAPRVGAPATSGHPLTVVSLAGGKIIGNLRMVATADDLVVGGLQSLFGCAVPEKHYLLRRHRFRLPRFRRGRALLLGAGSSDNYYHWLLDSLPRWKMLQAAGGGDYDYVLLSDRPVHFQDELLDRLNVPVSKRLRCGKNCVHQFEQLVVPGAPFPLEEASAWACAWLGALFPDRLGGPEKIYLSRRGSVRRRLVNEAELEARLEARGFAIVQPDRLSVAEQARLFGSARSVVAPHGAALSNLVFSPPGVRLIELFHPQHKNRCYVSLAAACGHHYTFLDGCANQRSTDQSLEYTVDIPAVLQRLAEHP